MEDQVKSIPVDLEAQEGMPSSSRNNNDDDIENQATEGSSTTATAAHEESSYDSFEDYTPPENKKISPPAKYKLFFLIYVWVYITIWFADEANAREGLKFGGWLSPGGAQFLFLLFTVTVLTYGALDLTVWALTFSVKGKNGKKKKYGLGPWLKAPRSKWLYKYHNVFAEFLVAVVEILEDGFRMFDAPPCDRSGGSEAKCFAPGDATNGSCNSCHKVLKIEHRVDPSKINKYIPWEARIDRAVRENAPGMVFKEELPYIGPDGNEIDIDDVLNGKLKITAAEGGLLRVIKITFRDLDSLNDWMLYPRRKFLMDELQPWLVEPDVLQIRMDQELPDAFTEVLVRQGESVAKLPPLKWKVCWITTIALFISITWVEHFMEHYYEFWGLNEMHPRIKAIVSSALNVFVNVYILVPLMLFFFDYWLKRKEVETIVTKEPWRTLNDGFQSIWWKALLVFAYYGGFVIAWIVRSQL